MHFISGLPRSGSTLLAAILKQNPRFVAGMSSPVASFYKAIEDNMSRRNEAAVFLTDGQRESLLRGVFSSYYGDAINDAVVFDTNRMWAARLPALMKLFPGSKVICCVRDIGWILDSFERLYRRNPFEPSGIYGFDTSGTVYTRTGALALSSGVVGYSSDALREACASDESDALMLVEYQRLCTEPQNVLRDIYEFVGEELFEHDFEHVEYAAGEFDRQIGARGLHDVSGAVRWVPRDTILPPDLFDRYKNDQFWREIQ